MDSYFNVVQSVREWCGLTIPLLTTYKNLNKSEKSLLLGIFGNAINKMSRAQIELNEISSNIKEAAGKMTTLQDHLKNKSDARSKSVQKFAESIGSKLNKAHTEITEINEKLKNQIETIENLKVQLEEPESYSTTSEPRNIAIDSAQKLIADCVEYRKIATY